MHTKYYKRDMSTCSIIATEMIYCPIIYCLWWSVIVLEGISVSVKVLLQCSNLKWLVFVNHAGIFRFMI